MQIIDPWNQASRTIEQGSRGEQAAAAIEKLRKRSAGEEAAPAPQTPVLLTPAPAPKT
jgi:regulator of protease activity HflC (stomatin/prohibitin superfamily)